MPVSDVKSTERVISLIDSCLSLYIAHNTDIHTSEAAVGMTLDSALVNILGLSNHLILVVAGD